MPRLAGPLPTPQGFRATRALWLLAGADSERKVDGAPAHEGGEQGHDANEPPTATRWSRAWQTG